MTLPDPPKQETASQTAGPYVHIGLLPRMAGLALHPVELGRSLVGPETKDARITVTGCIHDGAGDRVRDAIIEVWQADGTGSLAGNDGFTGWGRVATDFDTGVFSFETIKPGCVLDAGGKVMAPHLCFWIVARGINMGLSTRMYFPQDSQAHETDPVLSGYVPRERRDTLIARREGDTYHFDIHLQGARETVFFDV
ncbi:protocatechuate 3,4-dioxygenase subunit alpha [Roseobacter denitrificans]|uniref:Protocatechuate 3,4-dioxygenase, alpha subunit n=1 Tax=Roseobacter denitrificans (strain ATCC 33942 / OCh 114) TaxID=375451 RepID=Q161V0_ROSDO|nr:protocatechuate 3,4-dioxygenase subunit alpha [Roseobacter denitrificans]ABG33243.1 protocatechuate 3,4-dioxygenase, alpha subunit [Roseobacter denitrificans OCh 114]AVL52586.1 protocatechuate 3,4-dioxygenase subunit alpha [Roseobacter denitrificans]SFG30494.1 protocatechuate 3,4-dioxygenase, alpha subunit [Roseobacter denitrificans OCh 114]